MYKTNEGIVYSTPNRTSKVVAGETVPYRSTLIPADTPLIETTHEGIDTLKLTILKAVEDFGDEEFMGTRTWTTDAEGNSVAGKYQWRTYNQVYEDSDSLAKAIIEMKLYNEITVELHNYRLIGIYSKNNPEWVITDLA